MQPLVSIARTAEILRDAGQSARALTTEELRRMEALRRPADRDDFLAARVLVHALLRECVGDEPVLTIDQLCDSCGGRHGRPFVVDRADLSVSWTHANGLVAAAVGSSALGVDAAWIDEVGPPIMPRVGGTAGWARWTRTEALVKRGDGDLFAIREWPLGGSPEPSGIELARLIGHGVGVLTDIVADDAAWVVSVAAEGPALRVDF